MKKIYLLSLISLFFFACDQGTSTDGNKDNVEQTGGQTKSSGSQTSSLVKYPFKAGIVKYESEAMGMKTVLTMYFKAYGDVESSITKVEMMGKKMTMKSLIKDGYLYSLAMDQKSGTKVKIDSEFSTYRFDPKMIEEKLSEGGGKKLKDEEVLGKTCQVYSIIEEGVESKMWIWETLLMKMSAEQNGMTMTLKVTNIEETNNFPDGIFDIPADFNITEEDLNMDDDGFGDENAAG